MKRRKTPAGLDGGGYLDTLTAFELYTDWGEADHTRRRDMVLCMGAVLPYVRRAHAEPVEFSEWLADILERTPAEKLPDLWGLLTAAASLVDAERKPGRIAKKAAKALGLRCYTRSELDRLRAAQERMARATATPAPELWTLAREGQA